MDGRLTEAELLANAEEAGITISASQLKRFRDEGILKRPVAVGRPGTKGGPARVYPPETIEQLRRIGDLHAKCRRFDELRIALAFEGVFVDADMLRASLVRTLEQDVELMRGFVRGVGVFRAAERLAYPSEKKRPGLLSRSERRRLVMSREDESTLAYTTAMVSFGEEPIWGSELPSVPEESSPEELFGRVIGVDRAMTDGLGDVPPWLPQGFELRRALWPLIAQGALTPKGQLKAINRATDAEIRRGFNDARMFVRLGTLTSAMERVHGLGAFGFHIISMVAKSVATHRDRARLVGGLLILRKIVDEKNFEGLADLVEQNHDVAQQMVDLPINDEEIRRVAKQHNLPTLKRDGRELSQ
ncbi:MAG: hypothetical protein ACYDCC_09680 [Actinomycetota bacterium]